MISTARSQFRFLHSWRGLYCFSPVSMQNYSMYSSVTARKHDVSGSAWAHALCSATRWWCRCLSLILIAHWWFLETWYKNWWCLLSRQTADDGVTASHLKHCQCSLYLSAGWCTGSLCMSNIGAASVWDFWIHCFRHVANHPTWSDWLPHWGSDAGKRLPHANTRHGRFATMQRLMNIWAGFQQNVVDEPIE